MVSCGFPQALIFKFPAKPSDSDDFIPLLAEHSLADVARDTSREWKEAIVVPRQRLMLDGNKDRYSSVQFL